MSLPLESRRANVSADEFLEKGLREYLVAQASALPATMRQPVQTAVLDGWAAESLAAHGHATGVDLVVMTTHGRGGFNRFWLGSVPDKVVRSSSGAVLVVPLSHPSGESRTLAR